MRPRVDAATCATRRPRASSCALSSSAHADHNFWLARTPQFWLAMSPPPGQWIPIPELSDEFDCAGPEPTLRYRDEHASFETPDHGCTIDTNKRPPRPPRRG